MTSYLDPAHVEAVAEVLWRAHPDSASRPWATQDGFTRAPYRVQALRLLHSQDPAVHAALLAALMRAGVLSESTRTLDDGHADMTVTASGVRVFGRANTVQRRYATRWEEKCD